MFSIPGEEHLTALLEPPVLLPSYFDRPINTVMNPRINTSVGSLVLRDTRRAPADEEKSFPAS